MSRSSQMDSLPGSARYSRMSLRRGIGSCGDCSVRRVLM